MNEKYKEMLKEWGNESKVIIGDTKSKVNSIIHPIQEKLKTNTIDNITYVFGEFLYSSLGDRVTGQRSSVINKKMFESDSGYGYGIEVANRAKENSVSIETQLISDYKDFSRNNKWSENPYGNIQAYITVGRKFGMSYLTGSGDRVHTMYCSPSTCFKYLTQEHADCVKNKEKRKMVQEFLDYRDEFISGMKSYNTVVETDIPVTIQEVSTVSFTPKFGDRYNNRLETESHLIASGESESKITHIVMATNDYDIWNKKSNVNSYDLKSIGRSTPTLVSVSFVNIDDVNNTFTILGNIDMDMNGSYNIMDVIEDGYANSVVIKSPINNRYYSIRDLDFIKSKNFDRSNEKTTTGYIKNMDEVLQHQTVSDMLNGVVDFYIDMSVKLQEIKANNAELYFLNGDM